MSDEYRYQSRTRDLDSDFGSGKRHQIKGDAALWWMVWREEKGAEFPDKVRLTRKMLAQLKRKAQRYRVYFSVLDEKERKLMALVMMVVKGNVRSRLLTKIIFSIVKRLLDAMGGIQALVGEVAYKMRTVGLGLVRKISLIATAWGNKSASKWPEEEGFIQYATIMNRCKPL